MIKQLFLTFSLLVLTTTLKAQQNNPVKTFDFWIGNWETVMSTPPKWEEKKGIDSVSYLLGGVLIEEVFTKVSGGKANFQRGYLTFLRRENRWKHTIYDAKWGEYTFYGKREGDKVVLQSDPESTRRGMRRETFYNITADSFEYMWEASADGGKTWQEQWKVSYTRKK